MTWHQRLRRLDDRIAQRVLQPSVESRSSPAPAEAQLPSAAPVVDSASHSRRLAFGVLLSGVGGVGASSAALMPWVRVSTAIGVNKTDSSGVTGVDFAAGDAYTLIAVGAVCVLIAAWIACVAYPGRWLLGSLLVAASICTVSIAVWQTHQVHDLAHNEAPALSLLGTVSVGSGLYVLFVAAACLLAAGVLRFSARSRTPSTSEQAEV